MIKKGMRLIFFFLLELIFTCIIIGSDELDALAIFIAPILWLGAFGVAVWVLFICILAVCITESVKEYSDLEDKHTIYFLIATSLGCVGAGLALLDLFSFRLALCLFIQWPICLPLFKAITCNSKNNRNGFAE